MNIQNGNSSFGRTNQGQGGMSGQQMSVNNSVPRFGQVQAPPPTIPSVAVQPRLNRFQDLASGQTSTPISQNPSQIFGHFVDDPSQIDPREIPMDGTIAYYPTNDLSRIYAKAWDDTMNLMGVTYVPEGSVKQADIEKGYTSDEIKQLIDDRFAKFEEILSRFVINAQPSGGSNDLGNRQNTSRNNKGGNLNGEQK